MIRSYFGLTDNPFTLRDIELLEHQQEIHDTLNVHCQQGGLCLVVGTPGTGKSVIKESLKRLPDKQYLVATVARTLHTYTGGNLTVHACSARVRCFNRCKSCPGKGRPGRVAILAIMEVTKWSKARWHRLARHRVVAMETTVAEV